MEADFIHQHVPLCFALQLHALCVHNSEIQRTVTRSLHGRFPGRSNMFYGLGTIIQFKWLSWNLYSLLFYVTFLDPGRNKEKRYASKHLWIFKFSSDVSVTKTCMCCQISTMSRTYGLEAGPSSIPNVIWQRGPCTFFQFHYYCLHDALNMSCTIFRGSQVSYTNSFTISHWTICP